jgi:hypothetical protein
MSSGTLRGITTKITGERLANPIRFDGWPAVRLWFSNIHNIK